MKLPHLSIAAKLYAIFTLLATATVGLAVVAVVNARYRAALTDDFEAALAGALNVERVNGLIYAAEMVSRGILSARDAATAKDHAAQLRRINGRPGDAVTEWQWVLGPQDHSEFDSIADRIKQLQEMRRNILQLAVATPAAAGREGGQTANSRGLSAALNKDRATARLR